jgi:hypothetical protein
MRKVAGLWILAMFLALGLGSAHAQDENNSNEPAKAQQQKAPLHAYRIDFGINELEDGKKINTRHYSMNLNSGDGEEIKIGTRVPVATGSYSADGKDVNPLVNTQFQYMDVGTRIWCRLDERENEVGLSVRGEFSNISKADEQHGPVQLAHQPIIRNMSIGGSTLATPGKTVMIGVVDDPNSNREFQLEATVTRLQ